jgi:hypothetical protein
MRRLVLLFSRVLLKLAALLIVFLGAEGWADTCTLEVILSTPLSSRINRVGNKIQAVLATPTMINGQNLPTGTMITGRVTAVESSTIVHRSGRIRILFTDIASPASGATAVNLVPDTPDGWISQADTHLPVCKVMPGHSTRLLNAMIRRRLPCDRAVWNQVLGINSSDIPDPSTDEFIVEYHHHDVLLGAGDWLRLRGTIGTE